MATTMPDELRNMQLHMKGKDGVFIGRTPEMKLLTDSLLRQELASIKGREMMQTTGPGNVITGAPGAGKSSLLGAMAETLRREGFGVVRVESTDILTKKDFGDQMASAALEIAAQRANKLWHRRWGQLENWSRRSQEKKPSGIRRIVMRHVANLAQTMGQHALDSTATNLQKAWEAVAGGRGDAFGTLRLMDIAFPQGWLLCVDEVQRIHSSKEDDFIALLLGKLSNRDARAENRLAHGNLLMAGLNDSMQVLEDLGATRLNEFPLAGLTTQSGSQIARQHLLRGEKLGGIGTVPNRSQLAAELAASYHVWAHHMKAAALAAEWVAQHTPRDPHGAEWIHARAQLEIEKLYDSRINRAESHIPRRVIGSIIQQYHQNGDNLLYEDLTIMLNRAQEVDRTGTMRDLTVPELVRTMLHSGIVTKVARGQVQVQIPSLKDYCLRELPVAKELLAS